MNILPVPLSGDPVELTQELNMENNIAIKTNCGIALSIHLELSRKIE